MRKFLVLFVLAFSSQITHSQVNLNCEYDSINQEVILTTDSTMRSDRDYFASWRRANYYIGQTTPYSGSLGAIAQGENPFDVPVLDTITVYLWEKAITSRGRILTTVVKTCRVNIAKPIPVDTTVTVLPPDTVTVVVVPPVIPNSAEVVGGELQIQANCGWVAIIMTTNAIPITNIEGNGNWTGQFPQLGSGIYRVNVAFQACGASQYQVIHFPVTLP